MPLLHQAEIVKQHNVSKTTLHRWITDGKLTEHRTAGGHRRYDGDEVAKLISTPNVPKQNDAKKNDSLDSRMLDVIQNSGLLTRSMLAGRLGKQFNGDRDLYSSFGYVINPQYLDYKALYERMGVANRCVEILPDDTWRKPPILIDGDERSDGKNTEGFLKEWNELADRLKVWQMFRQVDIQTGLGRYAVLFMGAPGKFESPAQDGGVSYLSSFDESQATIQQWIQDERSPEYGMPKTYNITFNMYDQGMPTETGSRLVDHTRVIHIAENKIGSRVYGRPRLQTIINRMFDLEKVTGGSAEAVWLTIFKGFVLSSKEGSEMPAEGSTEMDSLVNKMTDFANRIQRFMAIDNAEIKDLGVDTITVRDTYDVLTDDLLGSIGVPKRIFFGSERGELASTQNLRTYAGKIVSRQTNFAEPEILRPFVNWCIAHKILSAPKSGNYKVWWPEIYEQTLLEKADIMLKIADAAFRGSNGVPENIIDPDELRSIVNLSPINTTSEKTMPGSNIVPTPLGGVPNRTGKDELGATTETVSKQSA